MGLPIRYIQNSCQKLFFRITNHGKECPDPRSGLRGFPASLKKLALCTEGKSYDYELNFLDNLKKDINYDYYNYYLEPIIINDKMYLSWYVWNLSGTKNAIIWIDYDFDKGDVKDFKILEE